MQILATQKPILVALIMAGSIAYPLMHAMTRHPFAQDREKSSALVVRVAVFSNDQGRLDDYRNFVEGHLFPTLRAVPGYVGTFLGRDATSGQLISLTFWRREADVVAGEAAVGRAIRALPQGSAPRPAKVENYVVEYRDINEPLLK